MGNAVKNITRSGTTFTATKVNNNTFTFTQQDNDKWANYTLDINTENNFDTWCLVMNGNKVQHRVIPTNLPTNPVTRAGQCTEATVNSYSNGLELFTRHGSSGSEQFVVGADGALAYYQNGTMKWYKKIT